MTIVLGMKTPQGVVLAADTQETYVESHKVNRPKLFYRTDTNLCGLPMVFAAVGAGVGPWLDKLTTNMWDAIQDSTNLDEACSSTENAITQQYTDFTHLVTFDPTADVIYAIGTKGAVRLFHAYGAIVNESFCRASGSGQAIADFLLKRLTPSTYITNAMALAIYVLMNAKRHADGCGGDSQVALVLNNGFSTELKNDQIQAVETVLDSASMASDLLVMLAGNTMFDANALKFAAKVGFDQVADTLSHFATVPSLGELLQKIREDGALTPGASTQLPMSS